MYGKEIEELWLLPNDQYTCPKCENISLIKRIDYDDGKINIYCSEHKEQKMTFKDYLQKMSKYTYFNAKCWGCKRRRQKDYFYQNLVFTYCYTCNKPFCHACKNDNEHQSIHKINELNNKWKSHYDKFYYHYCEKCNKNLCDECQTKRQNHGTKYSLYETPKEEDKLALRKRNKLLKMLLLILPFSIKLNELIIGSQNKFPYNYIYYKL